MNKYMADTMAIVLYLEGRKLPGNVKNIFNDAAYGKCIIYFTAVSLMEIGYLFEKQRIDTSIQNVLKITDMNGNFAVHSLDPTTITEAFKISNIPELHDRLITASAAVLDATLLTNDPIILRSRYVSAIWE